MGMVGFSLFTYLRLNPCDFFEDNQNLYKKFVYQVTFLETEDAL